MSVLSFPRLNFRGVFRTNPSTSNNDDVMPDVVERDSDTLGTTLAGMTDAEVQEYLREQVSMATGPTQLACNNFIRAGWNLYGDFTTGFDNAVITSVVFGPLPSQRATTPAQDPLVGQPVQLLGSVTADPARRGSAMICDLDPTGLVTTQLWVGGLQFGGYVYDHDTRAFQNWLNFFSTVGPYNGEQNFVGIGCTWQFAIPRSALGAPAQEVTSPGVRALLQAAGNAAGLVVRFRTFEVQPVLRDEDMYAQFQQGQAVDDPALGYLVGTIGVWNAGEPETEVAGRKLTVVYPRPALSFQPPGNAPVVTLPGADEPWRQKLPPALFGNAVAQVQPGNVISLDLVGTFPKFGFRDPDGPNTPTARGFSAQKQMANVGSVQLAAVPVTGGPPQRIATIDYGLSDYSTYDVFGGIVDIPFDPTLAPLIATGTLVLQGTSAPNLNVTLLQENTIRVVTDDRTMYLMPGTTNQPVRLKVYDRGGATQSPTTVYVRAYTNIIKTQTGGTCAQGMRPNQTVGQAQQTPPQQILVFPAQVVVPAGEGFSDWYEFDISAIGSGATILSYQLDPTLFGDGNDEDIAGVPVWSTATYSSIRVYPDEDFSNLYKNGVLQWQDVYEAAIRYYYLLFPAMSRFIPLNYPDEFAKEGALMKTRLNTPMDPGFWTTYNMPPTRTMSPAKVKLVLDFITQQQATQRAQPV